MIRFVLGFAVVLAGCVPSDLVQQPPEELVVIEGQPLGWSGTSGVGTTSTSPRTGRVNAYLSNAALSQPVGRTMSQFLRAERYRGKRLRLSGWVKPRRVASAQYSGLWMRVDGPNAALAFDNMSSRPVIGDGDWQQVSVVLDVDSSAVGIAFGALFQGTNTLLVDDLTLDAVGLDVTSTNVLTAPSPNGRDSASTQQLYARSPMAPSNLGFEGLEGSSSSTAEWIRRNAVALSSTDPTADLSDLDTLRSLIGTARIAGLGEATHGTKEFFLLKHRIVRYLVTRMGFTTFAIEATSPEADDLNEYVMNGIGTPSLLLFNLRFWIWDTRELLDMIRWMREWNLSVPVAQRVRFRGIDVQHPGASIDSVRAFIARESPADAAVVDTLLQCLEPYRNRGATPGRNRADYAALAAEYKAACANGLADLYRRVAAQRPEAPGYVSALHHARLVQQFEAMATESSLGASNRARDAAMAENVAWLQEQAGGSSKVIVWAHNDHITRQASAMGAHLQSRFGTDYRPLGFAFGSGSFYAVRLEGGQLKDVRVHTTNQVRSGSIEEAFQAVESPLLLLDLRHTLAGEPGSDPLRRPILMRNVGSAFDPLNELAFHTTRLFPTDFDLLLFVKNGTPSTSLLIP